MTENDNSSAERFIDRWRGVAVCRDQFEWPITFQHGDSSMSPVRIDCQHLMLRG